MSNTKRKRIVPKVQEVIVESEKPKRDWIDTFIEQYSNEEEGVGNEEPPKEVRKFKTVRVGHPDLGWVWQDIEEK